MKNTVRPYALVLGPFTEQSIQFFNEGTSVVIPALQSLQRVSTNMLDIIGYPAIDQKKTSILSTVTEIFLLLENRSIEKNATLLSAFMDKLMNQYNTIRFTYIMHLRDCITMDEQRVIRLDPNLHFEASAWMQIYHRTNDLYDDDLAVTSTYQRIIYKSSYRSASLSNVDWIRFVIMFTTVFHFFMHNGWVIRWFYRVPTAVVNFCSWLIFGVKIFEDPHYSSNWFATAESVVFPTGFKSSLANGKPLKQTTHYESLSGSYYTHSNFNHYEWSEVHKNNPKGLFRRNNAALNLPVALFAILLAELQLLSIMMNATKFFYTSLLFQYTGITDGPLLHRNLMVILQNATLSLVVFLVMRSNLQFTSKWAWLNFKFIFFSLLFSFFVIFWLPIYYASSAVFYLSG